EMRPRQVYADRRLYDADEEIEVLEGRERCEIEDDAEIERPPPAAALIEERHQPRCADLAEEQWDKADVPPAVEHERGDDQDRLPHRGPLRHRIIGSDRHRQKQQNETLRLEQHFPEALCGAPGDPLPRPVYPAREVMPIFNPRRGPPQMPLSLTFPDRTNGTGRPHMHAFLRLGRLRPHVEEPCGARRL